MTQSAIVLHITLYDALFSLSTTGNIYFEQSKTLVFRVRWYTTLEHERMNKKKNHLFTKRTLIYSYQPDAT